MIKELVAKCQGGEKCCPDSGVAGLFHHAYLVAGSLGGKLGERTRIPMLSRNDFLCSFSTAAALSTAFALMAMATPARAQTPPSSNPTPPPPPPPSGPSQPSGQPPMYQQPPPAQPPPGYSPAPPTYAQPPQPTYAQPGYYAEPPIPPPPKRPELSWSIRFNLFDLLFGRVTGEVEYAFAGPLSI